MGSGEESRHQVAGRGAKQGCGARATHAASPTLQADDVGDSRADPTHASRCNYQCSLATMRLCCLHAHTHTLRAVLADKMKELSAYSLKAPLYSHLFTFLSLTTRLLNSNIQVNHQHLMRGKCDNKRNSLKIKCISN